jgi:hypothetical protein
MVETFDRAPVTPSIEIHMEAPMTLPRTWFMSEDGAQLVQLQHDRFTFNWRELELGLAYPRYDRLGARFEELFGLLLAGLDELGAAPFINLCEVTDVNPVEYRGRGGGPGQHPDLAKIINRLRPRPRNAFLPEAEDTQLQARWRIPPEEVRREGRPPAGRLYLSASPGLKPPKSTPIYLVNLTARVIPAAGETDSAMTALDVGHKWAVLGFIDLTKTRMHREWGLMNPAIAVNVDDSSSLKWGLEYPVQPRRGEGIAIRLSGRTLLPPWADVVVSRIGQIAALPTDPRGSQPLSSDDVIDALDFLARVMRDDTPSPWIGRLNSGGVQLTWRSGDVEVEAVFDRARNEREVMVAVGENEWEAPADHGESLFATVVDRLAHAQVEHASTA